MSNTKDTQVGGNHYKSMAIQPTEYITKNELGYIEGNIVKYISRYKSKNGLEDLKKARHYLDMLIEDYQSKPLSAGDTIRMTHHTPSRVANVVRVDGDSVFYRYLDDPLEYIQDIEIIKSISEKM